MLVKIRLKSELQFVWFCVVFRGCVIFPQWLFFVRCPGPGSWVYQVFRCFILESALVNFCTLCQCLALCGVFVFCDEIFSCNVCVSYFLWTACDFFMLFFLVCFGLLAFLCSVSARCFVCLLPLLVV